MCPRLSECTEDGWLVRAVIFNGAGGFHATFIFTDNVILRTVGREDKHVAVGVVGGASSVVRSGNFFVRAVG